MTGHPATGQISLALLVSAAPAGGVLPAHRLALQQVPVAATGTGETGHDGVAAADLPPGTCRRSTPSRLRHHTADQPLRR